MSEIEKSVSDLKIKQVKITSNSLGAGSFGEVVEAVWINTPCAAKRLHLVFRMLPQKQQPGVVNKFLRECRTWSTLRHPHIVLFLGIVYEPESPLPVLIIEKMDTSLHSFVIDSPKEDFPLYRKGSVFLQVAQALCYLHSQGFVHRDLTPKNILLDLDSFKAKITDFGVTGVVNSSVSYQTSAPGNPAFMPPEASGSAPKYDEKLDTFSYGNVILFSTSGQWPEPEFPTRTVNGHFRALTEYERRAVHVDLMSSEEKKLFLSIIKRCLENEPGKRPTSKDLAEEMKEITSQIPEERPRREVGGNSTGDEQHDSKKLSKQVAVLKDKVRDINTKYFDKVREFDKLEQENKELQRSLKNLSAKQTTGIMVQEDGKSDSKHWSNHSTRKLFEELMFLKKENSKLKSEKMHPKGTALHRLRPSSHQFGSCQSLSQLSDDVHRPKSPTAPLNWSVAASLPNAMHMTSAVAIDNAVYIGGGYNASSSQPLTDIYKLDTESGAWVIMPRRDPDHTTSGFAIAAYKGSLHVIGGEYSASKKGPSVSDKVLTLDVSSPAGKWSSKAVHSLSTPRYIPGATVYMDYLLVAGGRGIDNEPISTMEIINLESKKLWTVHIPLLSDVRPQLVVLKGVLIVGGKSASVKDNMEIQSTDMKDLLASEKKKKEIKQNWTKDNLIPRGAAIFATDDCLCSVGGTGASGSSFNSYRQDGDLWVKRKYRTSNLTERQLASVVTIGDKIYALGGKMIHSKGHESTNSVDVSNLQ